MTRGPELFTILQPRVIMEDPHNCTDMAEALSVLEAVYDPLVRREGHRFVPALATGWEVAEAGRLWRFQLRRDVRFHDGSPLDASAVVATLERMARPDMGVTLGAPGVWAQYLAGARIEAPDAATVRVRLARPMADLLDVLAQGYVAAPSVQDDPVARPCGTGAYAVESVAPDRIAARANPDHWRGPPPNARLEWRLVADAGERLAAFRAGKAEATIRLPADGPAGGDVIAHMAPTTLIYLFNTLRGPLRDARVRRALNLALDRDALVRDVLGGAGVPLHGPFSPAHRGFVPAANPRPDRKAARALLAEAGHRDGLTLEVDTPTRLPDEAERLTAVVAAQLAPLGVELDVRVIPDRTEYAHMVRRSEMRDLCVFDSSPLSTYRVLREKIDGRVKGSWWLGYSNPGVEALIDAAAEETDEEARDALFRQCHEALVADPPWLFCYCHERRTAIRGGGAAAIREDAVLDPFVLPAAGAMTGGASWPT